jgi:hypothetical protein
LNEEENYPGPEKKQPLTRRVFLKGAALEPAPDLTGLKVSEAVADPGRSTYLKKSE